VKALVQRVSSASVLVEGSEIGSIGRGILALVGFGHGDTGDDLDWMVRKLRDLRIFPDDSGNMNRSLMDVSGELLAVSQFTLHANTRKGRRPSFIGAAEPGRAEMLFGLFVQKCRDSGLSVQQGSFGAMMEVRLVNDGPVTIMVDSPSERQGR
jgi:D-tyrosyl-tRNA(Tyr) deacylase